MTSDGTHLDPEIAGLLGEIPRYQGLRLLSEPYESIRGYSKIIRPGSPKRATSTERHLISRYREEVAWLLRRAAVHAMRLRPGSNLATYVETNRRLDVVGADELGADAEHYLACLSSDLDDREAGMIAQLLTLPGQPNARALDLAKASLRLVPRNDTRICVAFALWEDGNLAAAESLHRQAIAASQGGLNLSIALNNLGGILAGKRRFAEALAAFKQGSIAAANPVPAIYWLSISCQAGDERNALNAAKHLDGLVPPNHGAIEEHLGLRHRWPRTVNFTLTANRIRDRVDSPSRRILDA